MERGFCSIVHSPNVLSGSKSVIGLIGVAAAERRERRHRRPRAAVQRCGKVRRVAARWRREEGLRERGKSDRRSACPVGVLVVAGRGSPGVREA